MKFFLTALFFLTFATSSALFGQQKLTIVADEWPPFSGIDLPNKGMSLDVISTVLTRAGYDVETKVIPWARIINGATEGEFNIVGSLFEDSDLKQYLTYADPFFQTEIKLIQRTGGTVEFNSVQQLTPYSIAVGEGFLYEEEFDRATYLNKVSVTTALQAIRMVAFDRVDLTLDSAEVINHAIYSEDPTLSERVEFVPGALAARGIHMAVPNNMPGSKDIVDDFNRVLKEMHADGSLERILAVHTRRP